MICYGDREYVPQLKRLWKACFEDEDAYIDAFFDALYQREHVLMEEENGMLMGASFFLPGKIYLEYPGTEGHWRDIRYVYALAVWPQYRGRGIAGELLKKAHEIYQAPLLAEPAEEGLVGGFYKPLGFSEDFYLETKQIELPGYDLQAAQLRTVSAGRQNEQCRMASGGQLYPADAGIYCSIRDRRFRKNGYVSWPKEHVAFAAVQHRENGGDALVVRKDGREDILLYYVEDGQAVVTETTLREEEAAEVLRLSLQEPCRTVLLKREAVCMEEDGRKTQEIQCRAGWRLTGVSFGMAGVRGYLNITLD